MNVITEEDLWKTDSFVLDRLENSNSPNIQYGLDLLRNGFDFIPDEENPQFYIRKKFR